MTSFTGTNAVVTGASSGIGRAVSDELRDAGARLFLTGRRPRPDWVTAEDVYESGDLTDDSFVADLASRAAHELGHVDVLVIGHGLQFGSRLVDTDASSARHVLDANLLSAFLVLKHFIPLLPTGDRAGSIVCISSRLGMVGMPGETLYSAAKGGVIALARGAAMELAPDQIRVNVVAPGLTATETIEASFARRPDPEAYRRSREESIPLRRLATAEDVAHTVVFLASDKASHITGAVLPVDGGYTAF